MRKHLALSGLALAMFAAPATAQLDFGDGELYVQGFGGANWVDDIDLTRSGPCVCLLNDVSHQGLSRVFRDIDHDVSSAEEG
mgnify:CR=1 FL=1